MAVRIDASSFDAYGRTVIATSAQLGAEVGARLAALQVDVEKIGIAAIAAETPVGPGHPFYPWHAPGTLQKSTGAVSSVTGHTLRTAITQDAKSGENLFGGGGGVLYGRFVRKGRPGIIAPSEGQYSTGKKALLTPMGPRKSVGPAAANDYVARARPVVAGEVRLAAQRYSRDLALWVVRSAR